ncbi:hypothetical protein QBC42DRAFT_291315 [Cladorrhinum samala]|uniref:Uncharacterized protein n=1 Tax=Cladorrhinum samala TaxID=585594 RepID=A0AAV9HAS3_9PEZI|nr:hypothetical protein QBC42DRAFT_291315 [Cladorrhinum samala]
MRPHQQVLDPVDQKSTGKKVPNWASNEFTLATALQRSRSRSLNLEVSKETEQSNSVPGRAPIDLGLPTPASRRSRSLSPIPESGDLKKTRQKKIPNPLPVELQLPVPSCSLGNLTEPRKSSSGTHVAQSSPLARTGNIDTGGIKSSVYRKEMISDGAREDEEKELHNEKGNNDDVDNLGKSIKNTLKNTPRADGIDGRKDEGPAVPGAFVDPRSIIPRSGMVCESAAATRAAAAGREAHTALDESWIDPEIPYAEYLRILPAAVGESVQENTTGLSGTEGQKVPPPLPPPQSPKVFAVVPGTPASPLRDDGGGNKFVDFSVCSPGLKMAVPDRLGEAGDPEVSWSVAYVPPEEEEEGKKKKENRIIPFSVYFDYGAPGLAEGQDDGDDDDDYEEEEEEDNDDLEKFCRELEELKKKAEEEKKKMKKEQQQE